MAGTGAVGDTVVLRGRVEGKARAPAVWWSRAEVGGQSHATGDAAAFVLVTDAGPVEVRPPKVAASELEARLVPAATRRCTWEDLDDTLRERHASVAPGPGEKVKLHSAELRGGDEVVVRGRVAELGPVRGERAYREGTPKAIRVVDADVIGVGQDVERTVIAAADALAPPAPRAPLPWGRIAAIAARVVVSAPLAVLVVRTVVGAAPARPALLWAGSLSWAMLGAFATSYRPMRISATEDVEGQDGAATFVPLFVTFLLGFLPVLAVLGSGGPGAAPGAGIFWGLALATLAMTGVAAWAFRRAARFRSAFTPRSEWSVVEGRAENELHAGLKELRVVGDRALTVVLAGVERATEDFDASSSGSGRFSTTYYRHVVPVGGRVLVAGRFDGGDERVAVRGPRSLVMYGCGAAHAPRAVLDAQVRRLGLLLLQVAAGTALVVYALWVA